MYPCGTETLQAHVYSVILKYAARHDSALLNLMMTDAMVNYFSNITAFSGNTSCSSQTPPSFTSSPSQASVSSVVGSIDGSVGIQDGTQDGLQSQSGVGSFSLFPLPTSTSSGQQPSIASLTSTLACASDTFNPTTLMLDLTSSQQTNCWVRCSQYSAC